MKHTLIARVAAVLISFYVAQPASGESTPPKFSLKPGDVVMFAGGTNMVRLQRAGYFEAILTHAFAAARPKFRDLAWEADTVFRQGSAIERWRRDGFGKRDEQFARAGATVVIAQFGRLESMAGRAHGRIWRVSSEAPPVVPPKLSGAPLTEVLVALKSPERWTRYQAKRELTARDSGTVAAALTAWVKALDPQAKRHEHHLYEALGAYATIEVVEPGLLGRLLEAKDPRARAYAARVVGRWHDRVGDPLAHLARSIADERPLVRLEAVIACAAIPSSQSIQVAARLVDRPMDEWLSYAFTQAAHHLKPHWIDAFRRGELTFAKSAHLAAVLSQTGDRNVLESLKKFAASKDLDAKARRAAVAAIVAIGGPEELSEYGLDPKVFKLTDDYDAASHAEVLREVLRVARDRNIRPADDPAAILNRLLASPHDGLRRGALTLAGVWKVKATRERVLAAAEDERLNVPVRAAAFRALAELEPESAKGTLDSFTKSSHSGLLRAAAIEALSIVDLELAATRAAGLFADSQERADGLATMIEAFLSRQGGGKVLAAALKSSEIAPERAEQALQAFYATGRADEELVVLLRKLVGVSGEVPAYSEDYVKRLVAEARATGDATRGAKTTTACLACHKIGKAGPVIGPDLTAIGTTLSPERITEELLWPKRQVKEGYTVLQVVTREGEVLQGYERRTRVSQKSGDLVMRELASESLVTVRKDQIALRTVVGSAMPTGLTAGMTRRELLDLIRYLSELGSGSSGQ